MVLWERDNIRAWSPLELDSTTTNTKFNSDGTKHAQRIRRGNTSFVREALQ